MLDTWLTISCISRYNIFADLISHIYTFHYSSWFPFKFDLIFPVHYFLPFTFPAHVFSINHLHSCTFGLHAHLHSAYLVFMNFTFKHFFFYHSCTFTISTFWLHCISLSFLLVCIIASFQYALAPFCSIWQITWTLN